MATVASFDALVLAAGSAARFGGGKLLADFHGAPLLQGALAAARAAAGEGVVTVVTGADARAVAACARALDPSVRLVHAADHAEGMAASLRAGIASLPPDVDAIFVFLGDMPRVPHAVLAPLAGAVAAGAPAAAPIFGGRRGIRWCSDERCSNRSRSSRATSGRGRSCRPWARGWRWSRRRTTGCYSMWTSAAT